MGCGGGAWRGRVQAAGLPWQPWQLLLVLLLVLVAAAAMVVVRGGCSWRMVLVEAVGVAGWGEM